MKLNKDHYLSIFYILLGALILFLTSQITSLYAVDSNDLGPKFFPSLCGIGIVICGAAKFISSFKTTPKTFLANKKDYLRLAGLWLLLIVYVISIKYIGYIIASFILMFVMSTLLSDKNKPKVWQRLMFALIKVSGRVRAGRATVWTIHLLKISSVCSRQSYSIYRRIHGALQTGVD